MSERSWATYPGVGHMVRIEDVYGVGVREKKSVRGGVAGDSVDELR